MINMSIVKNAAKCIGLIVGAAVMSDIVTREGVKCGFDAYKEVKELNKKKSAE